MLTRRIDDDEPDVIDLTTSYAYFGSIYFPIPPPSPFADDRSTQSRFLSLRNEESNSKSNEINRSSSFSNVTNTWRKKFNRLLKRTKSNKHKQVVASDQIQSPYDFGMGEKTRCPSTKRVHWIDDDEMILNVSHRFIENVKLFVRNQIDDPHHSHDDYRKQCQIALNELDSFVDCQKIQSAFDDLIELSQSTDPTRLHEQEILIENLISHTVLFSSA